MPTETIKTIGGFQIIGIRSVGEINTERIILQAVGNANTGMIIVMGGTSNDMGVKLFPSRDFSFWLPDRDILAGEFVRIYSKKGTHEKVEGTYGGAAAVFHNFYWGRDSSPWIKKNAAFSIVLADGWTTRAVHDVPQDI